MHEKNEGYSRWASSQDSVNVEDSVIFCVLHQRARKSGMTLIQSGGTSSSHLVKAGRLASQSWHVGDGD